MRISLRNRSFAWSPEQLAVLTAATNEAVRFAVAKLNTVIDDLNFSDEQRAEALAMIANEVTAEMQRFVENLHSIEV